MTGSSDGAAIFFDLAPMQVQILLAERAVCAPYQAIAPGKHGVSKVLS